ncbi:MAG: ABC transporter permease [Planctomycetaceae bacterium]|nr:ABC transporter permease [Planctomycetaceae bacterium]
MELHKTRFWRHLVKDKFAIVAFIVIGFYFIIAILVFVAKQDLKTLCTLRVGPQNAPGFVEPTPEQRIDFAEFYLEEIDGALKKSDATTALAQINIVNLPAANLPIEEMRDRVKQAFATFDELIKAEANEVDLALLGKLEVQVDELYQQPTGFSAFVRNFLLCCGTDRLGRSILLRAMFSVLVAIQIGFVTALVSVFVGTLLGTTAGLYGGIFDHVVIWLYTTFSSIPSIVLLVLLAYMFKGSRFENTLLPVYVAFCATYWIGVCRVVRGETIKIRDLEYVQVTRVLGFNRYYTLWRHIWPNVSHLMLINFSLLFIGAIKSEVILSFLGLGVKEVPSWGIMISQSGPEVINGFFWQIGTATAFMFFLVIAFNIVSDFLQDVFDPKHL